MSELNEAGNEDKFRGHNIGFNENKEWIFNDTKQLVGENKNRPCGACGKPNTKEGYDGCLGELKGLMNACCGHGVVRSAYIQFLDGRCLYGEEALEEIPKLKGIKD